MLLDTSAVSTADANTRHALMTWETVLGAGVGHVSEEYYKAWLTLRWLGKHRLPYIAILKRSIAMRLEDLYAELFLVYSAVSTGLLLSRT